MGRSKEQQAKRETGRGGRDLSNCQGEFFKFCQGGFFKFCHGGFIIEPGYTDTTGVARV